MINHYETGNLEMENEREIQQENGGGAFSSINVKSFVLVFVLLSAILLSCGALSYFIPQGAFLRDATGGIIEGTYQEGEVDGIAVWRVFTAPFRVFASSDGLTIIFISLFLLIMSGVFNLLDKTNGIRIFIGKTVKKFSHRRNVVICFAVLIFMAFGSFFGMFEELATLLPLVVIFMLSMGMDTLTGLGICMLGACFGFSAAITNNCVEVKAAATTEALTAAAATEAQKATSAVKTESKSETKKDKSKAAEETESDAET